MGRLRQSTEKIQELLDKVESGEVSPDWNASEREAGYIKGRSHYIDGVHAIPFEQWDKRFDEDGNAIYFQTLPLDNYSGCLIREGGWQEENYVFFGTKWKSLSPAVTADIRINYDYDSGDSLLEIKLYRESDSESFLATFINNALFAYGQGEDFIYPIADEFIPDTIARTNEVDELREETTALWENLDHGTFPDLVAGDLAGRGESVPAEFGFRASGGKSIKDGRAYIKAIKGNSVVWNQVFNAANIPASQQTYARPNEDGTIEMISLPSSMWVTLATSNPRIIAGHNYLIAFNAISGTYSTTNTYGDILGKTVRPNSPIITPYTGGAANVTLRAAECLGMVFCIDIHDLTQMFGSGNEPTTIEEFNARVATLGVDLNAYNEGQVIHCNTESIKSVGDNVWDEEWRNGHYSALTGVFNGVSKSIANVNPIKILPNSTYIFNKSIGKYFESYAFFYDDKMNFILYKSMGNGTFTSPSNAVYMNFYIGESTYGSVYNHDLTISLYHSGWKAEVDNTYKPYWQDTLPLPIIRKYFPQGMKSAGTAHDEIRYNKATQKWEMVQRIGGVKMKNLTWAYNSQGYFSATNLIGSIVTPPNWKAIGNILVRNYDITYADAIAEEGIQLQNMHIAVAPNGRVYLSNNAYTAGADLIKSFTDDDILYYELAEPIVTELDAEDQNFRYYYNVADFGTEQSQSSVPSAAFSADIIYQFNAVDMIREHELEITELQKVIATMQAQLTALTNGGQ